MSAADILKDIEFLTGPCDEPETSFENVLLKKTEHFKNTQYTSLEAICSKNVLLADKQVRWKYLCLLLDKLLQFKSSLEKANEKEQMLSIDQKNHLSSSIEMVVTLGIVAHLPKGIGMPLEHRSSSELSLYQHSTEKEKTSSLKLTLSVLMELRKEATFCTIVTSHHLGDLLSSLFSLLLLSVWSEPVPEEERTLYKSHLKEIVDKTFQPYLIKELMLLNGNKECPPRLSHTIRCIMTERLMSKGGVIATIKAILDIVGDVKPNQWKIVSPFHIITCFYTQNLKSGKYIKVS